MSRETEVHKKLKESFQKIQPEGLSEREFYMTYLFEKTDDLAILKELKGNKELKMPDALKNDVIYIQAVRLITMMEWVDNWDSFIYLEKVMENKEKINFQEAIQKVINHRVDKNLE